MLFSLTGLIALAIIGTAATPAAQGTCATCPSQDLDGRSLVANSGGTPGVPKFCGYSTDASGASGPQVTCFYSNDGAVFSSSGPSCPQTTSLITCP